MNTPVAASPSLSLSDVIRGLRDAVAAWSGRGVLGVAVALLLYRRLGEIGRRMAGLAARFQAGRLWRRAVRPAVARCGAAVRARPVRVLPCGFGWLVKLAAHEAAGLGLQLRAVLEQPEMAALLAASPQAARVLRPLCRMLAVETSVLRPAEAVARVRARPTWPQAPDGVQDAACGAPAVGFVSTR